MMWRARRAMRGLRVRRARVCGPVPGSVQGGAGNELSVVHCPFGVLWRPKFVSAFSGPLSWYRTAQLSRAATFISGPRREQVHVAGGGHRSARPRSLAVDDEPVTVHQVQVFFASLHGHQLASGRAGRGSSGRGTSVEGADSPWRGHDQARGPGPPAGLMSWKATHRAVPRGLAFAGIAC